MAKHKPGKPIKKSKTKTGEAAARKRKAKIADEAKQKAKHTATLTKLTPIAKEINARLAKATQASEKAADHRLTAALRLAEAKALCDKNKLAFKPWVETNIERSYGDANKLAIAGATANPEEAVAELREGDAARRKKSQTKLREARTPQSGGTPTTVADQRGPFQRAIDSIAALDDKAALNLATDVAAEKGMVVISKHDHGELKDLRKSQQSSAKLSLDRVKHDFDGLVASEKMELVKYAVKKVGVEIVAPDFADPPDFLDRGKKKKSRGASPASGQTIKCGAKA